MFIFSIIKKKIKKFYVLYYIWYKNTKIKIYIKIIQIYFFLIIKILVKNEF